MVQEVRQVIDRMRMAAQLVDGEALLLDALADLLEYEVDTRHEIITTAGRGLLGGRAVMCSCGAMSIQRDRAPQPCGRLERAHAVALGYLGKEG